jgi:hypothetical protein
MVLNANLFWWSVYYVLKLGYKLTVLYIWHCVFALLPFYDIKRISPYIKNNDKERRTKHKVLRSKTYIIQRISFIITESRYPNNTIQCRMQYRGAGYIDRFTSMLFSLMCTKFYGSSFRQAHERYFRSIISIPLSQNSNNIAIISNKILSIFKPHAINLLQWN